jgi:hypothetical protein
MEKKFTIARFYTFAIGIVPNVASISASVLDEDTAYVQLKCVWKYDGNASLVEFDVRWIGDEFDKIRQINKIFNGDDEREYLYEHQYAGKEPHELPDPRNYAFNKEVCTNLYNNETDDGTTNKGPVIIYGRGGGH